MKQKEGKEKRKKKRKKLTVDYKKKYICENVFVYQKCHGKERIQETVPQSFILIWDQGKDTVLLKMLFAESRD